jgi:hypothetical protein
MRLVPGGLDRRFPAIVVAVTFASAICGCTQRPSSSKSVRPSASEVFALRTKCNELASEHSEEAGLATARTSRTVVDVRSNYNVEFNRCYLRTTEFDSESGSTKTITLSDAQTGDFLALVSSGMKDGKAVEKHYIIDGCSVDGHDCKPQTEAEVTAFINEHMKRDDQ